MINPYNDAKDLGAWKWMMKYHKKKMIFSFLFIGIFMVAPHIGQWKIEELWLRWLITGCATILNFVSTFLQPWTIWRKNRKGWDRWQENYDKGMYGNKKVGGDL